MYFVGFLGGEAVCLRSENALDVGL